MEGERSHHYANPAPHDRRVDMVLCTYAFWPKGTGHMDKDLGVVWLYYSLDSLQPFSSLDGLLLDLRALRASEKSKRSSFPRVYSHDFKFQG